MAPTARSPAMQQFDRFKRAHPDCALFFRMGDFYELFDDDAQRYAPVLGLTLTNRNGSPMAGLPYHQLQNYLDKAVRAGVRVAVCDQLDETDESGVMKRAVSRIVTAGTLTDESLLDEGSANWLAAVSQPEGGEGRRLAGALVELSTGRFELFDATPESLPDELARYRPSELLFAEVVGKDGAPPALAPAVESLELAATPRPGWQFNIDEGRRALAALFGVSSLAGFGLDDNDAALGPAGAIVAYLAQTQSPEDEDALQLAHLRPPRRAARTDRLVLDLTSLRSLEVVETLRDRSADGSVLGVFLGAGRRTPMGKRLLREWLCEPLARADAIEARQRAVATIEGDASLAEDLADRLSGVQDVERIAGRVAMRRASPRDLVALGHSLDAAAGLAEVIDNAPALEPWRVMLLDAHERVAPIAQAVRAQLVDEPPARISEGGAFRDGVDPELDEARTLQRDADGWLARYQADLVATHDLPNLKVGFNKVFGYYLELPAAQARRAPEAFKRRQTLKSAERYTTPELSEFETKMTSAEGRALERERALFAGLIEQAARVIEPMQRVGRAVAELDVLACFAETARRRDWTRPEMTDAPTLAIESGRHPVLADRLGRSFVPNDLALAPAGEDAANLALITGPNMAGKSTFIRQTALITLLAHAGSFVPAERAVIGLCDRIFTRVGADDALHRGQSTFMVEMTETAQILHEATGRSLIVLDEIGRGTSTLDGLSLAWAIAETLVGARPVEDSEASPPRTLFATHYHELTQLEQDLPGRVANLRVTAHETDGGIVFTHRILPGKADRSFGVQVAQLAGVPKGTIERAKELLGALSVQHASAQAPPPASIAEPKPDGQMRLFTEYLPHPAVARLRELKLDSMSPMDAFDALRRLVDEANEAP